MDRVSPSTQSPEGLVGIWASGPQGGRVGAIRVAKPSLPAHLLGKTSSSRGATFWCCGPPKEGRQGEVGVAALSITMLGTAGLGAHRGLVPLPADVHHGIMHRGEEGVLGDG